MGLNLFHWFISIALGWPKKFSCHSMVGVCWMVTKFFCCDSTHPHCLMAIDFFQWPRKGGMSYVFGKPSTYDIWDAPLPTFWSPTLWQLVKFFGCCKIDNWNSFSITIYNEGYWMSRICFLHLSWQTLCKMAASHWFWQPSR